MSCSDCVKGTLHEGNPVGRVETIHGLPTYVSDPPSGSEIKGIIVVISDAFGWELPNNRVLTDALAKRGSYTVYLPDFMDGKWLPRSLLNDLDTVMAPKASYFSKAIPMGKTIAAFVPWLIQTRKSVTGPRVFGFFEKLRTATELPIGTAGYCWGGKFTTLLCDGRTASNGKTMVDAGYTAHPSSLELPTEIEAIKLPYCLSIGDKDMNMNMEKVRKVEDTLKSMKHMEGKWEVNIVEGAVHGFAVRGDPTDEKQAQQCQQAEDQAVEFLGKWLGKGSVS